MLIATLATVGHLLQRDAVQKLLHHMSAVTVADQRPDVGQRVDDVAQVCTASLDESLRSCFYVLADTKVLTIMRYFP